MKVQYDYSIEPDVIENNPTLAQINDVVIAPMEAKASNAWKIALTISSTMFLVGIVCWGLSFYYGTGLWGNNQPVGWAFPIVNFVFWVGIGHCRDINFGNTLFIQAKMENRNRTIC